MTRYKQGNINGRRVGKHVEVMCLSLGIEKLPKNFIVHHIDGNKHNNDIDNLSLITITAHNRIHTHTAWNKGVTIKNNTKWKETIIKAQLSRNKHYLPILKEYYDLRNSGMSAINIGIKFNKSRATIYSGIKKYERIITRRKRFIREPKTGNTDL